MTGPSGKELILYEIQDTKQRRIQDFFKEGVVMSIQGKRPRAKRMGKGEGGMFKYVDFLHFDFRGINLSNLRH